MISVLAPSIYPRKIFWQLDLLRFGFKKGQVIKVQDYISMAGQSDGTDIHYMTVQPLLAVKLSDKWWAGADMEVKVSAERDKERSCKSGVIILRMWTKSSGTWVKPEIPRGPNREADWILKASLFWTYRAAI